MQNSFASFTNSHFVTLFISRIISVFGRLPATLSLISKFFSKCSLKVKIDNLAQLFVFCSLHVYTNEMYNNLTLFLISKFYILMSEDCVELKMFLSFMKLWDCVVNINLIYIVKRKNELEWNKIWICTVLKLY